MDAGVCSVKQPRPTTVCYLLARNQLLPAFEQQEEAVHRLPRERMRRRLASTHTPPCRLRSPRIGRSRGMSEHCAKSRAYCGRAVRHVPCATADIQISDAIDGGCRSAPAHSAPECHTKHFPGGHQMKSVTTRVAALRRGARAVATATLLVLHGRRPHSSGHCRRTVVRADRSEPGRPP